MKIVTCIAYRFKLSIREMMDYLRLVSIIIDKNRSSITLITTA